MQKRTLGRTGLEVSAIGFGCGMVGGLMVGGTPQAQQEAVARATDAGIDYFDTAPFYGGGRSEENLGRALRALKRRVTVGTKFRLEPAARDDPRQMQQLPRLIRSSVEESLKRLGLECLDLLQLHNPVSQTQEGSALAPVVVKEQVLPAFQALVRDGLVRFVGITALGDPLGISQLFEHAAFDTAQVSYNLLDPSSASPETGILQAAGARDTGVIGIRLLAGGSLSGQVQRHEAAMQKVIPLGQGIGSGADYAADVACAQRFGFLVREGQAPSLAAAAIRYGLTREGLHTLAIGFSGLDQLDEALQAAQAGAFDKNTLARIERVQAELGILRHEAPPGDKT